MCGIAGVISLADGPLSRLESALQPSGLVVLVQAKGEDREACIRRHGHDETARGLTFLLLDDADARA